MHFQMTVNIAKKIICLKEEIIVVKGENAGYQHFP